MTMTAAEIRLKANPILSHMLLGMGQGTMIAEKLMPRLPQVLANVNIAQMGDADRRRYNLRRAPGSATKRINIKYDGKVYSVEQYAVEVPIPRELVREADESRRLNIQTHLDISQWQAWPPTRAATPQATRWHCRVAPSGRQKQARL